MASITKKTYEFPEEIKREILSYMRKAITPYLKKLSLLNLYRVYSRVMQTPFNVENTDYAYRDVKVPVKVRKDFMIDAMVKKRNTIPFGRYKRMELFSGGRVLGIKKDVDMEKVKIDVYGYYARLVDDKIIFYTESVLNGNLDARFSVRNTWFNKLYEDRYKTSGRNDAVFIIYDTMCYDLYYKKNHNTWWKDKVGCL